MSDDEGPWSRPTPKAPPPAAPSAALLRRRLIIIAACLAFGASFWWLRDRFPEGGAGVDWQNSAYAVGLLAIAGSALLSRRLKLGQIARYGAIWGAIIGVLLVGYTLRDDLAALGPRMLSEITPSRAVPVGVRAVAITPSDNGSYYVIGEVNGQRVKFLVDTGSSDIVLSPDDARRIGVNFAQLNFDKVAETANGLVHGATYTAPSLSVGPIRLTQVAMSVNQAPMSQSLLGMTFLRRLESFEFKGRQLVLRGRP